MSATVTATEVSPVVRLEVLFEELAELTGQRNAIDGRLVEIVAEIDRDELWGTTGARSVPALVAWKTGTSPGNAHMIATVAQRLEQFPRCAEGMREGRFSLDQIGVIAERAADGSDEHYAQLAASATVSQLRTAVKLEPRTPIPNPSPSRSARSPRPSAERVHHLADHAAARLEAAIFDAALQSHQDALVADWKRDHAGNDGASEQTPPFPGAVDGFMSLIEAGWDTEVTRRPHGQRTTVIVHLDVEPARRRCIWDRCCPTTSAGT